MARLMRFSWFGLPIGFLVLVLGCANTGQNNYDRSSGGLPVAQGSKVGLGQPTIRAQQPVPAPAKYGSLPPKYRTLPVKKVSLSSEPSSPKLSVADKYQIRICAWVNGKPIFKNDVMNEVIVSLLRLREVPEPTRTEKRREILEKQLKKMIDQEVVYQDAYNKLKQSPQFMKQLKEASDERFEEIVRAMQKQGRGASRAEVNHQLQLQGSSLQAIREREEKKFFVQEYIRSRVQPYMAQISPRDIRKYYDNHQNEFQTLDRLEWEDLFVEKGKYPSREKALEVAQYLASRLQAGDPVEKLLKYDDGLSSRTKGKGIGQRKGEIVPAQLEPYLFQLKAGQVGPIYELATGFHIYRVTEREYAGQQAYTTEVQKEIHNKLRQQIGTEEYDRIVRELSAHAVIEVNAEMLK